MNEEVGAEAPKDESPEAGTPRPSTNGSSTETVDRSQESVNPNLTAALAYQRRGWSVFPLVSRTKRPLVKIEAFLSGERRLTEDEVRTIWTENPEAGVAIVMGAPSGLVAIDVDPRNGGDLEQTARDCPTDLVAQTGGGGLHLFVRHPGAHVPKGKTSRPGVDRQADGSYVVAAPSLHPDTGEPYRWLNEGEPGVLPEWALEKPAAATLSGKGDEWITEALRGVGEGQRNDTCARLAGYFASKGIPEDVAERQLLAWNLINRPPMTDAEVVTTVRSAFETARRNAKQRESEPAIFRTLTLAELERDVMSREEESWLCKGWVPGRGPFMVAGPSHVGKTWLMLDLAMSVAMGRPFLGKFPVQQGPVLFVAGEDDAGLLRARFLEVWSAKLLPGEHGFLGTRDVEGDTWIDLRIADYPPNLHLHTDGGFRFGDDAREAALLAAARRLRPRLIVLDPFKDLVPAKELTEFMAGSVHHLRFVRQLRDELGCAIGIVHHTGKNEERALTSAAIQGNAMFVASFDTRWIIAKTGERAGVINREMKATASQPFVKYTFATGDDGLKWTTDDVSGPEAREMVQGRARHGADDLDERVLTLVKKEQPISRNKVCRAVGGKKQRVLQAITALMDGGQLADAPEGLVTPGGSAAGSHDPSSGNREPAGNGSIDKEIGAGGSLSSTREVGTGTGNRRRRGQAGAARRGGAAS
jgi:hypothetical protein